MDADPLRMFLVLRRGAPAELPRAAELVGAAAVACVRRYEHDPEFAATFAAWRPQPGKVTLRARGGQWAAIRKDPHSLAGDPEGDAALALPPRRRSARGPVLERMQAHSPEMAPPPAGAETRSGTVTYLLNPGAPMSSGKTLAQIAHAAVMAADTGALEDWVQRGCPALLCAPDAVAFARAANDSRCVAQIVDSGLTELPPATVTVRVLVP